MYEEKKKKRKNFFNIKKKKEHPILDKIRWRHLGLKITILLLVIILIIFTIARINKYQQNQNKEITNNINKITEEIIKYYTINNTFPKNIGDSSSLLLKEMRDLKIIDEIKDKNNNSCNYTESYIILTKSAKEEYRLKVYLKCSKKEKTEEKIITCSTSGCQQKK